MGYPTQLRTAPKSPPWLQDQISTALGKAFNRRTTSMAAEFPGNHYLPSLQLSSNQFLRIPNILPEMRVWQLANHFLRLQQLAQQTSHLNQQQLVLPGTRTLLLRLPRLRLAPHHHLQPALRI